MSTCGDFGGLRKDGEPCGRRRLTEPCPEHREEADDSLVQQKKEANQGAFLRVYRKTGNISVSAGQAGIGRQTVYDWKADDPEFRARFEEAGEHAADLLEAEARRRAVVGVEEPVGWYRGEAGGTVRKYSDTLLIFLLKGIRPEKYRERHEVAGRLEIAHVPVTEVRVNRPSANGKPNGAKTPTSRIGTDGGP